MYKKSCAKNLLNKNNYNTGKMLIKNKFGYPLDFILYVFTFIFHILGIKRIFCVFLTSISNYIIACIFPDLII